MKKSALLAEVNRSIRGFAIDADPADEQAWEFVCECGRQGCKQLLGLSLAHYDDLRAAGLPVLADGHPIL